MSSSEDSIGSMLAQTNDRNMEQAVYYLSRVLTNVEHRYMPIKKLCLALYFSCIKLICYMLPVTVEIMCKIDVIKYMLSRPIITSKIAKWTLALLEFHLKYMPQKVVKRAGAC